jgi:hypothetical protein
MLEIVVTAKLTMMGYKHAGEQMVSGVVEMNVGLGLNKR